MPEAMKTEELIEAFMDAGLKAFKSERSRSSEARKLDRHETIELPPDGVKVSYWREFVAYKMAEWIQETVPTCTVELELAGNDTTLTVELTDEERKLLSSELEGFIGRWVR
jgi:hypothetical protein